MATTTPTPARVGVIGAGVMGAGIAQSLAVAGFSIRLYDIDHAALERARDTIESGRFGLAGSVERGKLSAGDAAAALERVETTTELAEARAVDLVIEAIPEQLDLKLRFWRETRKNAPSTTIFASNSSGFPIAAMAAVVDRPQRMIGWHWASPAPIMRLAEIVRGPETSDETVATVVEMARRAGKNPVVVKDTTRAWGYVANRIYAAMAREANQVVAEGIATREEVDQLMMDCYRWPSGPFGMSAGARAGWK